MLNSVVLSIFICILLFLIWCFLPDMVNKRFSKIIRDHVTLFRDSKSRVTFASSHHAPLVQTLCVCGRDALKRKRYTVDRGILTEWRYIISRWRISVLARYSRVVACVLWRKVIDGWLMWQAVTCGVPTKNWGSCSENWMSWRTKHAPALSSGRSVV